MYKFIFLLSALLCGGVDLYGGDRACITQTYLTQVGVVEATGHNDGKEVGMYLKSTGLGQGYAWCAAFVNWCLKQCGIHTINDARAFNWFSEKRNIYKRGVGYKKMPQPGDLCGFIWTGTQVQHIGFVHVWSEQTVKTVEGNTSMGTNGIGSREGDGVCMKRRMQRTVAVVANYIDN